MTDHDPELPDDLNDCVRFHGHLCPGLIYGYVVAKDAMKRLDITRASDEEIIAIIENDSCAVDGIQKLLGTTAGKGNLIIRNHGKNVYTIQSRRLKKAIRFSRRLDYRYQGEHSEEFEGLEQKVADKSATPGEMKRQKRLKALDLMARDVGDIFTVTEVAYEDIDYASLAPSRACAHCGELTMQTRMVRMKNGELFCLPCSESQDGV